MSRRSTWVQPDETDDGSLPRLPRLCAMTVTLGRRNDLRGTCWERRRRRRSGRRRRREKQLGATGSLVLPFPLVSHWKSCHCVCWLFLKWGVAARCTFTDARLAVSHRPWPGLWRGCAWWSGGLYNISREWWYALVIFWSSLARHIPVPRWTNKRILLFFFAGAAEKNFP